MKNEIILTVGLPRSGKTTWSRNQGYPIVNPDSIRLALHGKRFEPLAEDFVWAINFLMIRALILAGHNKIIVDATHNTKKRRDIYFQKFPDCLISFKTFPASREECILRAKAIKDNEIIPIINKMANEFEPVVCK